MNKLAIVSVFDKTGLIPFASFLKDFGVDILSTGGTKRKLEEAGLPVKSVSDYTGHPEILDGRVKSLHPKIHGGILARRDREEDLQTLINNEILPVDFVIVNLYPFTEKLKEIEKLGKEKGKAEIVSLVEDIDIGGPTMIRAAAKNSEFVVPICSPSDYPRIEDELREHGVISNDLRQELAAKVFAMTSRYDAAIARYFSLKEEILEKDGSPKLIAPFESVSMELEQSLRYGENPHQKAALFKISGSKVTSNDTPNSSIGHWQQIQGKELSYNNIVDMQGALDLFLEMHRHYNPRHTAVIIKHTNPCGAAVAESSLDAFLKAKACDPVSSFGGIIAVSGELDIKLSEAILNQFVEVVLVESISEDAKKLFQKKKNVRLILCDFKAMIDSPSKKQIKLVGDHILIQEEDYFSPPLVKEQVVTSVKAEAELLKDMQFAWIISKFVKSNTIVLAKNEQAIGVGAGQMSRVDAARISVERAKLHGFRPEGSVAASDAFLPFPDTLEVLNNEGVVGLVQPGGSVKDQEVINSANQRKMTMLFTGERHFRH